MTLQEAIRNRHSVRAYEDKPIEQNKRAELDAFVEECNRESGLDIKVVYDDPEGFDSRLAHYGSFRNVNNYIVLAGKSNQDIDERCGYFGEKIVLKAQTLGLNTCWVGLTFNKKRVKQLLPADEKLCIVIALGYGRTEGKPHKGKEFSKVCQDSDTPDWFKAGVEAALLAPTAVNQQKFRFSIKDGTPVAEIAGFGPFIKVDLGIVKYHFEVGAGRKI